LRSNSGASGSMIWVHLGSLLIPGFPCLLQPREKARVVAYPVNQLSHTVTQANRRLPTQQALRLANIIDKHGLIAWALVAPLQRYLGAQLRV
jgi:hypothetical protein